MGKSVKRKIVVSAVNIFQGGALTVLLDCLDELSRSYSDEYEIIALVSSKKLLGIENISYIEFPKSRKSYLFRLYYEYFYFKKFSRKTHPYLWISLHDISPNVIADKQVVYCHNPSIFYNVRLKDLCFEPSLFLFSIFYEFFYKKNILRNEYVIVQQNWIKQEFTRRFGIHNVLTAYPFTSLDFVNTTTKSENTVFTFFFPSIPRCFKNFEIIGEAVKILRDTYNGLLFKVILTLNGNENGYSKYIYRKYFQLKEIHFIGQLTRNKVFDLYSKTDCLIFPSKLETWGLPISEFKQFNKPILASDLPYAHETVGNYNKVCFFNPDSPKELASLMYSTIKGIDTVCTSQLVEVRPDAENWNELLQILINN